MDQGQTLNHTYLAYIWFNATNGAGSHQHPHGRLQKGSTVCAQGIIESRPAAIWLTWSVHDVAEGTVNVSISPLLKYVLNTQFVCLKLVKVLSRPHSINLSFQQSHFRHSVLHSIPVLNVSTRVEGAALPSSSKFFCLISLTNSQSTQVSTSKSSTSTGCGSEQGTHESIYDSDIIVSVVRFL